MARFNKSIIIALITFIILVVIFLMQKDVVDRILSKEGSPNAGALSIRMQLLSKIKRI